jgi:phosphatidylserine decarboxylase
MTREGYLFPLPFFGLGVLFFYFFMLKLALPFLYIATIWFYLGLTIMLFFRDPTRKIPPGDNLILSPADGKVIKLDNECTTPALSIFLSVTNVHVNRSPVNGVIKSVDFHPGKYHVASRQEAMTENQRNEIEIETANGIVRMHQVSGAIARRAICYKKPGDSVKAGERIGLIRFGSRVDLMLPAGSKLDIVINRKVLAGETILGYIE